MRTEIKKNKVLIPPRPVKKLALNTLEYPVDLSVIITSHENIWVLFAIYECCMFKVRISSVVHLHRKALLKCKEIVA